MAVLGIVDHLRTELPIGAGITRNDAATRPPRFARDTLYVWPETDQAIPEGTGILDDGRFLVRAAYTVDRQGEPDTGEPVRAVSEALDSAVDAITDWVREHRLVDPHWEHLEVARVQYDAVRGFEARGHFIDLTGYRLLS